MIERISIENFKSIDEIEFRLGRVNVLIGANGSGKSNILEAIGMLAAKSGSQVELEAMAQRGIRIAMPELMVNSFYGRQASRFIRISLSDGVDEAHYRLSACSDDDIYTPWEVLCKVRVPAEKRRGLFDRYLSKYAIYSSSIDALRGISSNSKLYPLGLHGEGLDVLLFQMSKDEQEEVSRIASRYISWLDDLVYDAEGEMKYRGYKLGRSNSNLYFNDRFMQKRNRFFSAENANEGALIILFYLVLMISKSTPDFFAIDNFDSGLNPRLCRGLMKELPGLAREYGKQVILTTHNPALLDGIRLGDEETCLYAVERSDSGSTLVDEIRVKPRSERRMKLSEMWMNGMIGGVPEEF